MFSRRSALIAMVLFSLSGAIAHAGSGVATAEDQSFRLHLKHAPSTAASRQARAKIRALRAQQARQPLETLALRAPIEIDNPVSSAPGNEQVARITMPRLPASQPRVMHRAPAKAQRAVKPQLKSKS